MGNLKMSNWIQQQVYSVGFARYIPQFSDDFDVHVCGGRNKTLLCADEKSDLHKVCQKDQLVSIPRVQNEQCLSS